jgi:hypothetical protein
MVFRNKHLTAIATPVAALGISAPVASANATPRATAKPVSAARPGFHGHGGYGPGLGVTGGANGGARIPGYGYGGYGPGLGIFGGASGGARVLRHGYGGYGPGLGISGGANGGATLSQLGWLGVGASTELGLG